MTREDFYNLTTSEKNRKQYEEDYKLIWKNYQEQCKPQRYVIHCDGYIGIYKATANIQIELMEVKKDSK